MFFSSILLEFNQMASQLIFLSCARHIISLRGRAQLRRNRDCGIYKVDGLSQFSMNISHRMYESI